MKLGTGVGGWPGKAPEQAQRAEKNGYDYINCGELAHDSMPGSQEKLLMGYCLTAAS